MEAAINAGIASTTDTVVSLLTTNIPLVLVITGGLIGLFLILRVVYRTVGRK